MPLVLVDQLASSTVNLKAYFWFDSKTYAPIKLRSALMRQTKQALLEAGISMPDEAREVILPKGLPIYGSAIVGVIRTSYRPPILSDESEITKE